MGKLSVNMQLAHRFVHFLICFFVEFLLVLDDASSLLCSVAEDVLLSALHLRKVKFWASHPPVDVFDVVAGRLKVSRSIVGAGDENLVGKTNGIYVSGQFTGAEKTWM